MNEIFKKGDTVYHWKYGKGTIETCYEVCAHVQCLGFFYIINYNELSFTPYTLPVDHVRPTPDIEKGQLIWVRDSSDQYWQLLPFEVFFTEKSVSIIVAGGIYWNLYSITNPYDTALPCFQK